MDEEKKSPFQTKSESRLLGVLQWPHFETLWAYLRANPEGWYLWDMKSSPPRAPLAAMEFKDFLEESGAYLRARHKAAYFGAIYANDLEEPSFMKIYDPKHMGSACNVSGKPIDPRWILSREKPDQPVPTAPVPKKGLRKLFQRA